MLTSGPVMGTRPSSSAEGHEERVNGFNVILDIVVALDTVQPAFGNV